MQSTDKHKQQNSRKRRRRISCRCCNRREVVDSSLFVFCSDLITCTACTQQQMHPHLTAAITSSKFTTVTRSHTCQRKPASFDCQKTKPTTIPRDKPLNRMPILTHLQTISISCSTFTVKLTLNFSDTYSTISVEFKSV